jgi:hypothetical protein
MSKTKTGSNAQYTSAGKGLTVIGNHAYAYSGAEGQGSSAGEVTKLDFTTGNHYIVSKLAGYYGDLSNDWWKMTVFFNEIRILQWATNHNSNPYSEDSDTINLIIPPLTNVRVTFQVGSDADYTAVTLIGKIHG